MKYSALSLLAVFICLCCSCDNHTDYSRVFDIYLLEDPEIHAYAALEDTLPDLILQTEPVITVSDLNYYKWSEHCFSINKKRAETLAEILDIRKSVHGVPFVITVSDERIYVGAFWYVYSSLAPTCPHILVTTLTWEESTEIVLRIEEVWTGTDPDPRDDLRIYNALKATSVLIE